MKLRKILRELLSIFIVITMLILNVSYCYAGTLPSIDYSAMGNDGGEGGEPGDDEPEIPHKDYDPKNAKKIDGKYYVWAYDYNIISPVNFIANAYDIDGTSVMPVGIEIDTKNYNYKAGTWMGINVTKKSITSWEVFNITYREVKKEYSCIYEKPSSYYNCKGELVVAQDVHESTCKGKTYFVSFRPTNQGKGVCEYYEVSLCKSDASTEELTYTVGYKDKNPCPKTYPGDSGYKLKSTDSEVIYEDNANNNIKKRLKKEAINEVYNKAKKTYAGNEGIISYTKDDGETKGSINGATNSKTDDKGITETADGAHGQIIKEYEFLEKNVCINVKTTEVTYGDDCKNELSKNKEEIMKIPNGSIYDNSLKKTVNYWHYFAPLKTKSNITQIITVEEKNTDDNLSGTELDRVKNGCINFVKKNKDNYKKFIMPLKDVPSFDGDYNGKNEKTSKDIELIKKVGCKLATVIEFPITQEFYREIEDKDGNIKFNGFNFYYKPLNINDPFPNGLPTNSLWKEWSKNKTPDLSKSFASVTYKTSINTSTIRSYNQSNPYTSWDNININGISKFIEEYGVINRQNNQSLKSSIYKLGCGPYNEDWGECD